MVILTECDFPSRETAMDFKLKGFTTVVPTNFEHKVRTISLVKNEIKFKQTTCDSKYPFTVIEAQGEQFGHLVIVGIYRQINEDMESQRLQLSDLEKILDNNINKMTCVIGDFNLDANRINDPRWTNASLASQLKDICDQNSLSIVTPGPTYSYKTRGGEEVKQSALDYSLLTQNLLDKINTRVIGCGFSDHQAIEISLERNVKNVIVRRPAEIRCRSKILDETEFRTHLKTQIKDNTSLFGLVGVNEQATLLTKSFQNTLDVHAPWKIIKSKSNPTPNLSSATKQEMKSRNAFKNKMFNLKLDDHERLLARTSYKAHRNNVTRMIREDKKSFVLQESKIGTNCWKIAKKLLGTEEIEPISEICDREQILRDEKSIATCLNDWFIEKTENLKRSIDPNLKANPFEKLKKRMEGRNLSFSFRQVKEWEVKKIISTMKTSKSSGIDGISSFYLKKVKNEITPGLTVLINNSFESGVFPETFKSAKITPIWKKKGDKNDKSMYRPISGLSVLGKVIEALADLQLRVFLENNNLLGTHQHGFRKIRSTNSALLSTFIKLKEAKERKKWQGVLCFDLSAAYDVLDVSILLEKLKICGVLELGISWLKSFLTNRKQAVQIGQAISEEKLLDHGIPQGSSISCLLFIFFVGDYPFWIDTNAQAFADDTIIYLSGDSPIEVLEKLEIEAGKTFNFFASNGLVANPGKTVLMIIRPKGVQASQKYKIRLEGQEINESPCERVLGINLSNDLTWTSQIKKVKQKINHGLFTLRRVKNILDKKSLRILAEGLIMSHLRYCISTFLSDKVRVSEEEPRNKVLHSLQLLQNKMLRIIFGVRIKDKIPTWWMLDELGMLSVNQVTCQSILMDTWKSLNLGIESVSCHFKARNSARFHDQLQSNSDPKSFVSIASKLYNISSDRFKLTNLTKVAQQEAKSLVKRLPII